MYYVGMCVVPQIRARGASQDAAPLAATLQGAPRDIGADECRHWFADADRRYRAGDLSTQPYSALIAHTTILRQVGAYGPAEFAELSMGTIPLIPNSAQVR
jgi:hypothetical protein